MRNLQASYNDAEALFQEYEESEEELRAFSGFALASETVEYPDEPLVFNDAWDHPNEIEQKGWREAIIKEFDDMSKRKVWEKLKETKYPKIEEQLDQNGYLKEKGMVDIEQDYVVWVTLK